MHSRRARSPVTVLAVQRCVLVLLTLVASLMHLTRTPGAGGLGLSQPAVSQSGAARPALQASAPADSAAPLQTDHAADHMTADHGAGSRAPDRHAPGSHAGHAPTDAAPNAPPTHADHAAPHCPFCLTAGFALTAAPATVLPPATAPVAPAAVRPAGPAVSAVRHADPRAPPTLG